MSERTGSRLAGAGAWLLIATTLVAVCMSPVWFDRAEAAARRLLKFRLSQPRLTGRAMALRAIALNEALEETPTKVASRDQDPIALEHGRCGAVQEDSRGQGAARGPRSHDGGAGRDRGAAGGLGPAPSVVAANRMSASERLPAELEAACLNECELELGNAVAIRPALRVAGQQILESRACRVCGCLPDRACESGCSWAEFDLGSVCAGQAGGDVSSPDRPPNPMESAPR